MTTIMEEQYSDTRYKTCENRLVSGFAHALARFSHLAPRQRGKKKVDVVKFCLKNKQRGLNVLHLDVSTDGCLPRIKLALIFSTSALFYSS
jgi:hypothetical protein